MCKVDQSGLFGPKSENDQKEPNSRYQLATIETFEKVRFDMFFVNEFQV